MQDDRATYGARVGAALVDILVIVVVVAVIGGIAEAAGASEEALGWIIVVCWPLATAAYGTALLIRAGTRNGQTLGKQALKVRAVRADGHPMDTRTAAMRETVGRALLGLLPFYTIIDSLFPLTDSRRQALHDKLARTFVVTADAVPDFDRITPSGDVDAFGRPVAAAPGPSPDRPPAPSEPAPARPRAPSAPHAELPGGFAPPEPDPPRLSAPARPPEAGPPT